MKKFSEMTTGEIVQIINRSKDLRDKLDNYIQDCEMDYLEDKLSCVKGSLSDWSVGFYNQNFINVEDYDLFLDGVIKHRDHFGASERIEKKIKQCEKLRGTNLFNHHCEILEQYFMEDEIERICDYVEDASYELYDGEVGEKCYNYVECFADNFLSDYLYDEEESVFYKPTKITA